ncbi:MAG: large conductance mechanosensitive channel protein MscL [Thermoleophilia bacterium]|jgi:large conductance mechanosensitive channel|nr:large conductance mechanosensitive channel protein MscL [Thermoleophilia bacterium]
MSTDATGRAGAAAGRGKGLWQEFKDFAFSGNLIQLAVAVVLGVAFKDLIDSFVAGFITPIIAALTGDANFSALTFSINGSQFRYGAFIDQLISFIIIALVLFFVIKGAAKVMAKKELTTRPCDFCTEDVSRSATRCPHCTSELSPAA